MLAYLGLGRKSLLESSVSFLSAMFYRTATASQQTAASGRQSSVLHRLAPQLLAARPTISQQHQLNPAAPAQWSSANRVSKTGPGRGGPEAEVASLCAWTFGGRWLEFRRVFTSSGDPSTTGYSLISSTLLVAVDPSQSAALLGLTRAGSLLAMSCLADEAMAASYTEEPSVAASSFAAASAVATQLPSEGNGTPAR
jgi:hypothetical protein